MLRHIWIIITLRWQMFQNTFSRSKSARVGSVLRVVSGIIVILGAILIGVGAYFLGKALGGDGKFGEHIVWVTLLLEAMLFYFLMFRMVGIMVEIQREEPIDFKRLLYLPLPLRTVYLLNFGMSLFSIGFPFYACAFMGLCFGLAVNFGVGVLLGIPIGLALYVMVSAWCYFLQGVCMQLLKTKRKRRMAMMAISLMFVLPGMGMYLVPVMMMDSVDVLISGGREFDAYELNFENPQDEAAYEVAVAAQETAREESLIAQGEFYLTAANSLIPVGWMPLGITALVEGQWMQAWLCLLGLCVLGGAGLYYGYRSTMRHYVVGGHSAGGVNSRPVVNSKITLAQRIMEWRIPLVSEITSTVASSYFLAQVRHTMIWSIMIMPFCFAVFLVLPVRELFRDDNLILDYLNGDSLMYMVVMVPFLSGMNLYQAFFGTDIGMFRAFVLLPGDRRHYLLGINIALFLILGGITTGLLLLAFVMISVSIQSLIIALLQLVYVAVVFSILGNFISIYFPFRIDAQNKQAPGFGQVMILMCIGLGMMVVLALLYVPTMIHMVLDWFLGMFTAYSGPSAGILVSLACAIVSLVVYWVVLPIQGRLLESREKQILATLTQQKS